MCAIYATPLDTRLHWYVQWHHLDWQYREHLVDILDDKSVENVNIKAVPSKRRRVFFFCINLLGKLYSQKSNG